MQHHATRGISGTLAEARQRLEVPAGGQPEVEDDELRCRRARPAMPPSQSGLESRNRDFAERLGLQRPGTISWING